MKYKLIALDLDGTVLNNDFNISEYTSSVLRKLNNMGIKIIIATGRSYSSLKPKIKELNLRNPIICYNGAMIRNEESDSILQHYKLSKTEVKKMIDISRRDGLHMHGFINEMFYYEVESEYSEYYRKLSGLSGVKINFDKMANIEFTKCMFISKKENLLNIEQELKEEVGDNCYIAFSKPTFLEIMNESASKSKALQLVMNTYGIEASEVLAFGDGLNDEDMLSLAGKGIVMKNGYKSLKEKFESTTYTNNQDGVAKYLEELLNE